MKIAKLNGLDALITISNQFASLPTHHPVMITRPPPRGISLFHWSWMSVVTTATLLLLEDDFESAEQKFLLSEFVRYFEHPASGVQGFDRMNAEWKDVVTKVQTGAGLSRNSDEIINTVGSWHQETRDLCLILTRALGARVRHGLSRTHAKDAGTRLHADCATLVDTHKLTVTLDVRDAASPITIVADLRRRAITCSMRLEAPADKKRAVARTNWLLRQLKNTDPGGIVVDAIWPRRSRRTQAPLADLRADPRQLEAGMSGLAPVAFEVFMVRDLAGRFSGRKTFVEALESVVPEFYERVGQQLRAWVPPPPKLEPRTSDAELESAQQTANLPPEGETASDGNSGSTATQDS